MIDGWIIGAIMLTAHVGDKPPRTEFETVTPGVYAVAPNGITAGVYSNSIARTSVYAGYTFRADRWALTAAAVTGYPGGVRPLVAASYRFGDSDYAPRVSWIPHRTAPVSLAIERRF